MGSHSPVLPHDRIDDKKVVFADHMGGIEADLETALVHVLASPGWDSLAQEKTIPPGKLGQAQGDSSRICLERAVPWSRRWRLPDLARAYQPVAFGRRMSTG